MNEPRVCAIMLTRDRPELAAKAVECFRRQTYDRKILVIWDTGDVPYRGDEYSAKSAEWHVQAARLTIGAMRNRASEWITEGPTPLPDILIHWDDDDWSDPNRIAEQVAFLQMSGADVVGYNQMLFWRDPPCKCDDTTPHGIDGSGVWLYTAAAGLTPALGTSLCYWRKTWERQPFNPALPKAGGGMSEEAEFLRGLKCASKSSMRWPVHGDPEPRMIARIHGANFGKYDIENQIARGSNAKPGEGWARIPHWDDRVREILG